MNIINTVQFISVWLFSTEYYIDVKKGFPRRSLKDTMGKIITTLSNSKQY